MEVKIFLVEGKVTRPGYIMPFAKEVRALKNDDAVEKVLADLGSQQKAKRIHVKISSIKEIPPEDVKNVTIRELNEE